MTLRGWARALRPILAVLVVCCSMPAAAHAGAITLDANTDASSPSIGVAADGTAHIAWTVESTVGGEKIKYCRLPRGAASCNKIVEFIPDTLQSFDRPGVIVRNDGRIQILAGRCCDGVFDHTWLMQSTTGGNTFAAPKEIGDISPTHVAGGPTSNAVTGLRTGYGNGQQVAVQVMPTDAGKTTAEASLEDARPIDVWESGGLGFLNSTTPIVAMTDLSETRIRRFNSANSVFNIGTNWWPSVAIPGENEPTLVSGSAGTYVMTHTEIGGALGDTYRVRRINENGGTIEDPVLATEIGPPSNATITADQGGAVTAVWTTSNFGDPAPLRSSIARTGGAFATPGTLIPDAPANANYLQASVAPDHGGFVVFSAPGGTVSVVPIPPGGVVSDPPPPAPPAGTPPGATPPGATPPGKVPAPPVASCQITTLRPGVVATALGGGCWGGTEKVRTYDGTVDLNGVVIAPQSGKDSGVVVDVAAQTIFAGTSNSVSVGAVVLSKGKSIAWNTKAPVPVDGLEKFGVSLLGLKPAGSAEVSFAADESLVSVNLELPYPFNGVRGRTTLRASRVDGLGLDGVHVRAAVVPIGPIELRNLDLEFVSSTDGFEGSVDVYLPPAAESAISAKVGIEGGAFKHLDLEAGAPTPPLPLPLFAAPPIVLSRVGLAVSVQDGFKMTGGVKLTAGPEIAGRSIVAIDALPPSGVTFFVPKSGKYAEVSAKGKVSLIDVPLASGYFGFRTDGAITFGGGLDVDFEVVAVKVSAEGGLNFTTADFYGGGKADVCVSIGVGEGCVGVQAIMSSLGFAACGKMGVKESLTGAEYDVELGFERPWGGKASVGGCQWDKYVPLSLKGGGARAKRLQAGGPQVFTLGSGTQRGVRVTGAGARPGFTLVGPGGRTIQVPPGFTGPKSSGDVISIPVAPDTVELQVKNPAGSWTLTPDPAGPAVTVINAAALRPVPKVRASVRSAGGRSRSVTLDASNLGDQQLVVREVLPGGGGSDIGTVKRAGRSTLRFTPVDGPAGKRQVEVIVVSGGRQVEARQVASFTAPSAAKLPAPRSVSLKRSKSGLAVRWAKVPGAARYRVLVRSSDGREEVLAPAGKATRLAIPQVTGDDRVSVAVYAVSRAGASGSSKVATSAGKKVVPKKPKVKKAAKKK